jgi:hypothetical protein
VPSPLHEVIVTVRVVEPDPLIEVEAQAAVPDVVSVNSLTERLICVALS